MAKPEQEFGGSDSVETSAETGEYSTETGGYSIGLEESNNGRSNGNGLTADTEKPKRKPGRPPGTGKKNRQPINEKAFYTGTIQTEKVANKKKSSAKQTEENKDQFVSIEEAQATTQFILTLMETYAVHLLGEEAKMSNIESALLVSSLPPYMATLKKSSMEKLAKIAYPAAIIGGFGLYGSRLMRIAKNNQEQKRDGALFNETDVKLEQAEERLDQSWMNATPIT